MGRISERKIEWESICRDLDMEKRDAKKIVSYIKETMKKLGIDDLTFGEVSSVINAYNYVNLTNMINDIDDVDLLINKYNFSLRNSHRLCFLPDDHSIPYRLTAIVSDAYLSYKRS